MELQANLELFMIKALGLGKGSKYQTLEKFLCLKTHSKNPRLLFNNRTREKQNGIVTNESVTAVRKQSLTVLLNFVFLMIENATVPVIAHPKESTLQIADLWSKQ